MSRASNREIEVMRSEGIFFEGMLKTGRLVREMSEGDVGWGGREDLTNETQGDKDYDSHFMRYASSWMNIYHFK